METRRPRGIGRNRNQTPNSYKYLQDKEQKEGEEMTEMMAKTVRGKAY